MYMFTRDVYGAQTAPRSVFFILKISPRADIRPSVGKVADYCGADILPSLNMSRGGADFFECVTERSGYPLAAGKVADCHGADIRRYRWMSRVIAERMSVARFFFHEAVYFTPSSIPHKPAA